MRLIYHFMVAFACLVSFESSASAACNPIACDEVYISHLRVSLSGDILIDTTGDESLLNCTLLSGGYITLSASHPGADKIYAMLLSAQAQGKPIGRIRIQDGSSPCHIAYVWQLQ
ncbi:hypothetical protein [Erythrobacter sp. SAORIC-644]|uniref:hypothetical protein n=1 Tax=Erythrobacter sp. SAORIC-644 TaxID=1869314 RepID=UPI001304CDAB|nr:hypothetical protein [Erythrobacter sp. SAORIC-644]